MRNLIDSVFRVVCVAVFCLLGFSSCDKEEEVKTPTTTYFRYWGRVTDQAGNPIKGIHVIMSGTIMGMPNAQFKTETYMYGEDESIFMVGRWMSMEDTQIKTIDFVDVDGEENGGDFESVTITPQDMEPEYWDKDVNPKYRENNIEYKAEVKLKKK